VTTVEDRQQYIDDMARKRGYVLDYHKVMAKQDFDVLQHGGLELTLADSPSGALFRAWCADCGAEYTYRLRLVTIQSQAA
jgi:hypothetical protein